MKKRRRDLEEDLGGVVAKLAAPSSSHERSFRFLTEETVNFLMVVQIHANVPSHLLFVLIGTCFGKSQVGLRNLE